MTDLKDMAYTEAEQDKQAKCCDMPSDYKGPKYPWGLELHLETESLKKLGVDISTFKVGQEVPLHILGKVTSLSIHENEGGEARKNVTIIAAKIGIDTQSRSKEEQIAALYGEKK